MEVLLIESKGRPDAARVKLVLSAMSCLMRKYPLLVGIDKETVEIIARKVSPQKLLEYSMQVVDAVHVMKKHGIKFRYETNVVSQLFQPLYQSWIVLQGQPMEVQEQVIRIMLDGIIDQVTEE